jgi:hypothetical protein
MSADGAIFQGNETSGILTFSNLASSSLLKNAAHCLP